MNVQNQCKAADKKTATGHRAKPNPPINQSVTD